MDTNGHPSADAPSVRLLRRLDDTKTAAAIERLLDRLDLLTFAVDAADGFLRRGEQLADNIGDALQEARGTAPTVDAAGLAERIPQLTAAGAKLADATTSPAFHQLLDSGLLDRLAAPETLSAIQTLLDKLPLLAFTATAVEGFLHRGEELADNFAEGVREVRNITSPIEPVKLHQVISVLPKVMDAVTSLITAGLFDPEVVAVLVEVGKQAAGPYHEAKQSSDRLVGRWGMFKALGDPDVQRALGVGLYIVKRFGQTFNRTDISPPPAGMAKG